MFKRIRNLHPVSGIVVGAVATLVLSGTAIAVTDTSFTYNTVKTGYLTIHPMDLAPGNDFAAGNYTSDYVGGELATPTGGCYTTGVNLPDRAKVMSLQTFYTGDAKDAALHRNNLDTDASDDVAIQFPAGTGPRASVSTTIASDRRTVFNNIFSYGNGICLNAGGRFEGARITYTYTSAGD